MMPRGKPLVLITGYRGLAETLIEHLRGGFQLSVLTRQTAAIPALRRRFPDVHFFPGDLADEKSAAAWIENAFALGTPEALINNAALPGPGGKLHEADYSEYETTLRVNLSAPAFLSHLLLRRWEKTGANGVIINLSGGGATRARPGFSAYAITKTALVRLTETLAAEYPRHRFYAIAPGALMTPMIEAIWRMDPARLDPGDWAEAKRREAEGGESPKRAAELTLWLLHERPAHLSGKLIHVADDYRAHRDSDRKDLWTLRRIE
jgi:NAD(P)-dependent dehydrogenase (short-subunit alcohol dehydrogenase family)